MIERKVGDLVMTKLEGLGTAIIGRIEDSEGDKIHLTGVMACSATRDAQSGNAVFVIGHAFTQDDNADEFEGVTTWLKKLNAKEARGYKEARKLGSCKVPMVATKNNIALLN